MTFTHRDLVLTPPNDPNVSVWRYVDLARFLHLLETSSLFFARADTFADPFEGSLSVPTIPLRERVLAATPLPPDTWSGISHIQKFLRQRVFLSCWHMNEYESAAMWELYAPGGRAIALRSTYQLLRDALGEHASLGTVRYIDYSRDPMPPDAPYAAFFHKRRSFEHERELRAISFDAKKDPLDLAGRLVKLNVNSTLQSVHVSPFAPAWYVDLLRAVMSRFGVNVGVQRSSLEESPLF